MIPFSNHPLYRALWGWLGPPEVSLLKLAQGPVIRRASVYAHVVQASLPTAQAGRASSPADPPPVAANPPPLGGSQESIMPLWRLPEGIAKFDDWFGAYPLLVFPVTLCPALPARLPSLHACGSRPSRPPSRPSAPSTFSRAPPSRPAPNPYPLHPLPRGAPLPPSRPQVRIFDHSSETGGSSGLLTPRAAEIEQGEASGLWVDLGAYGVPRAVREGAVWDAKENIRAMEHWTREVGGWQALYTDIFCTPTELRQMFDFSLLDKARKRHDGVDAFPEVYDKVKSEAGISDLSAELAAERAAAKKGTAAGRRSQSAATSVKSPPRRRSRSRSPRPIRG